MTVEDNSTQVSRADDLFDEEDAQALAANRLIRRTLVRALTEGNKVPESNSDKSLLLGLMDGIDREILGRARLKIAAKSEENNSNMTAFAAQILKNHTSGATRVPGNRVLDLPDTVRLDNPIPGELDDGLVPITFDNFTKQHAV